jgi:hypothetical protein
MYNLPLLLQHDVKRRAASPVLVPREAEVRMQSAEIFSFTQ